MLHFHKKTLAKECDKNPLMTQKREGGKCGRLQKKKLTKAAKGIDINVQISIRYTFLKRIFTQERICDKPK